MFHPRRQVRTAAVAALALVGLLALSACGSDDDADAADGATEVHLGYFPNLTHAVAIVGVDKGFYADALGDKAQLSTVTFNAGPDAVTALLGGSLDIAFIGPNPTVNAWAQSEGEAIHVIAGAASGGAALVVSPDITSADQLKGKTLSTPQLGNTQDVALRYWLKEQGLTADETGGGDVSIMPQENGPGLDSFVAGTIDGAWVPEPWATRYIEAGAHVLVDEATLWPEGRFVTTNVVVRTAFLEEHPDLVEAFLQGELEAVDYIESNPTEAQQVVNDGLEKLTTKRLDDAVLAAAWKNITFTLDPIAESLPVSAQHAQDVGLLDPVDLAGIYDIAPLNEILKAAGKPEIAAS